MEQEGLGPNGGVVYALETLEANFDWLRDGLARLGDDYILFDCPGQVELFTHHDSLKRIFKKLEKLDYRVCPGDMLSPAGGHQPRRFLLLYRSCTLRLGTAVESQDHAADGFPFSKRPHQNRSPQPIWSSW